MAGDRDKVRDFDTARRTCGLQAQEYITSARLTDSVFNMVYLDLKEGMEKM
jgi:hypothetical protein